MQIKKNRVWAMAALLGGVIGLSSCLKQNDPGPQRMNYTGAIINGAYLPSNVDIFNNGGKMNSGAYKTGNSAPFLDLPGLKTFSFRQLNGVGLDSVTQQLDSLKYYTIITYNDGTKKFTSRLFQEDFSSLSQSKVNFRFINLSPNAGAVDLYINNKKVAENQPFSVNASWQSVDPFSNSVEYYVTVAGETAQLVKGTSRQSSGSTQVAFQPGYAYTIYLAGAKDSTGDNKLQLYYLSHTSSY
ncbi:DUF4397 domain-containing protein [Chitinophaga qingshengii]|uniref:DUF4397 domain-containing protein n=1 Tax=Chitinophaga qingshengii TaxID=1569794 RepID=A0ABR7TN73_9BACT|nr:DUF4397 domain-containing protein [Chitinophaga qingshengii]MBC9931927.1 DUF4397 domain-containing protein [Chitinophaga qingshengii]